MGTGTLRRECGDLGHGDARRGTWGHQFSGGRGDRWDGDAVREIQGHGGHKDINDNCKSQR